MYFLQLRLPKHYEQAPSNAWQRIQKCYFYAKSTSQCARKLRTSYALIGNRVIWLVAPDSRNLTQVHDARQTRPSICTNKTWVVHFCLDHRPVESYELIQQRIYYLLSAWRHWNLKCSQHVQRVLQPLIISRVNNRYWYARDNTNTNNDICLCRLKWLHKPYSSAALPL